MVSDYALSEAQLRESRAKRELLGMGDHLATDQIIAAAAHVMDATVDHIEAKYGGIEGYVSHIGLTEEEMQRIRHKLMAPTLQPGAGEDGAACSSK